MITAKQKIYLAVFSFLILFVVLFVFQILPLSSTLKNYCRELSLQEATLELLKQQLSGIEEYRENASIYQKYLSDIDSAFIAADAPIVFMEFLESEAERENLTLEVAASALQQGGFSLIFQVNLRGPFANASRLLERLEESHWLMALSNLRIIRLSDGKSTGLEPGEPRLGDVDLIIKIEALARD